MASTLRLALYRQASQVSLLKPGVLAVEGTQVLPLVEAVAAALIAPGRLLQHRLLR